MRKSSIKTGTIGILAGGNKVDAFHTLIRALSKPLMVYTYTCSSDRACSLCTSLILDTTIAGSPGAAGLLLSLFKPKMVPVQALIFKHVKKASNTQFGVNYKG